MLIGYRDYVSAAATALSDGGAPFEAGAPLSNAALRQLAVVARRVDNTLTEVHIDFGSGVTIGMFAILAHNLGDYLLTWDIRDTGGSIIQTGVNETFWNPGLSPFPAHLFRVLDANVLNIRYLNLVLEATNGFLAPPEFGRLWAGPVWRPETATGRRNFRIQTRDDDSVIERSDGQQAYADAKSRCRQLTCTLPYLTEAEAVGAELVFTDSNLQDIGFQAGKTETVIVIPTTANQQVIHKMGLYSTFAEPPPIDLIEESAGSFEDGLAYSTQFDAIEEL